MLHAHVEYIYNEHSNRVFTTGTTDTNGECKIERYIARALVQNVPRTNTNMHQVHCQTLEPNLQQLIKTQNIHSPCNTSYSERLDASPRYDIAYMQQTFSKCIGGVRSCMVVGLQHPTTPQAWT